MFYIPKDLTEFLYWFKERTETFWRQNPRVEEGGDNYTEWPAGIRWIGLPAAEIDAVETRYNVRFAPDHREFLRILHTLDQSYTLVEAPNTEDEGGPITSRMCYNWLTEENEIRQRLANPYEDLHTEWLTVWGPQPESAEARLAAFSQQFGQAPALLPIHGHRYVVNEPQQVGTPVLSMWGTDIIIYGWNLRDYLIREFGHYLDIPLESHFDEEDQCWYKFWVQEAYDIHEQAQATCRGRRIPFYEDFIQTWNGWPPRAGGGGQGSYGPILDV